MTSQQQLWTRLEAFSQQVHGSLQLREVACIVADQGRQLIECDRVAVVQREGRRTTVEAVSGVETIDARARQVRLLRDLGEHVLLWGERLVYRGVPEDSLPPDVLTALNAYLAESSCNLLVVLPLCDGSAAVQFALVLECFEPVAVPEQLQRRLEVLGRHSRGALHNAAVYRRVPLRFLWQWLAPPPAGRHARTHGGDRGPWPGRRPGWSAVAVEDGSHRPAAAARAALGLYAGRGTGPPL